MTQPEKRNMNSPLSSSVFDDDNTNVNQSRPPTRVSKDNSGLVMRGNWGGDTGLYQPQKGSEYNKAIRVSDVDKINEQAWKLAMKNAKGQGGKRVKNEDGSTTWMPGPFHTGEPVPYSYEKIVKGDDGKWTRKTINSRMRKPGGSEIVQIPKKKVPFLRDEKGKVQTYVDKDGVKRARRGIQNTPINKPIKLKGKPRSTSDASVEAEKKRLNIKDNTSNKTNIKINKPQEVNVSKTKTSSTKNQPTSKKSSSYSDAYKKRDKKIYGNLSEAEYTAEAKRQKANFKKTGKWDAPKEAMKSKNK